MAESKPIKYSQIAEPNLLDPLKKELEQVNKLLDVTEQSLKGVVTEAAKIAKQTPLDSFENLEQVEKGIQDTVKAVKDLDKIEKDRVKLQQRLKELDDERVKANFYLREQVRLQTKELRDNARAAAASGDAYEVLKKQTNDAQKRFKTLAAEFGATSKQAEEARKEFNKLDEQLREVNDAAKDGRRDVGRYEKGVQSLNKTFKAFASATIILKILELLQNSVSGNTEGAAEFEKIWVRVTATFQVVGARLVDAFQVIQNNFSAFATNAQLQFAKLTDIFKDNSEEVKRLQQEYDQLSKNTQSLGGVFTGIGAEIQNLIDKNVEAIDKTLEYRKAILQNEEAIARQIGTQRELQAAFDNDASSLEEQIRAGVAYRDSLRETQALEADIARNRQRVAQLNAEANPFSLEAREELAAANRELAELLADQVELVASTEREIQKLRDDATQLNLDFYIDDFDNRKTVNERIIADETQTFERRKQLLEENLKGAEASFDLQEEALNKSLRERGKAQLDFDELRKKSSSEEIARTIREAGISEPLAIRALEVLRERRTFLQDNAEAQRDLNAAEAESRRLQDDILLQQEALNALQEDGVDLEMVLADLSEQRLQNEIDNLRERIDIAEDGSAEFIRLNQELNDRLLEQDQERFEKEKALQDERLKQLAKFAEGAQEAFSLLNDIFQERSQRRIDAIDEEIATEEERANRLSELAAQGNEDAENNLAVTEQRQAELELRRQQQIERQQRQELAFTAIQTYAGKVQSGDPNPLASTISDISVLRAFINALPGFYEGTEDTGTVTNPIDSKGGRLSILHDNERVIDKANNKIIGKMSNTELAMLANREKNRAEKKESSSFVVRELRELKQITKDKPSYLGMDYDQVADAIVRKVQKGNKIEKIHKKNGGIWG